jgi:hypothetical protein
LKPMVSNCLINSKSFMSISGSVSVFDVSG